MMLYKNVAQTSVMSFSGDVSDYGSEDSFSAPSIANSVASNMTGKVEEQFDELQKTLSRLSGSTLGLLVSELQKVSDLGSDEDLTSKDLKRALGPVTGALEAVQQAVGGIEADLLALRASNEEISSALLTFENYMIQNAVFFKKVDLVLSGVTLDEAEDDGDDFAQEIRERNEDVQGTVQAYTKGLNEIGLEVQQNIATRLGLEPVLGDYVPDPSVVRLTGEALSAFTALPSGKSVAKGLYEGASVGGFKYREDYNALRGETHSGLVDVLEILTASIAFPLGKNFGQIKSMLFQKLQDSKSSFELFLNSLDDVSTSSPDDGVTAEALANVARDLETEVHLYSSVITKLQVAKITNSSPVSSAAALKPIVSELSSFLMSPKDDSVSFSLARMGQQVIDLIALYSVSVPSLPVRLTDLQDHLILGHGLKLCKSDTLAKKTLERVLVVLQTLQEEASGETGLLYYRMVDTLQSHFDGEFSSEKKK
jgi:hypothetical protein